MALRLYESIWDNNINRTFILSVSLVLWTLIIELYFLFWPIEAIETHILFGIFYNNDLNIGFINISSVLLDLFHITIWSACFFFSWITYTLAKQLTNSSPAGLIEFIVLIMIFSFFIYSINVVIVSAVRSAIITGLFIIIALGQFLYLYFALNED